jgi:hypothetical protein
MSVEEDLENTFTEQEQSMVYKDIIRKGKYDSCTKEFVVFTNQKGKHIKVQFTFSWSYDEDGGGFQYSELSNFSGHGRYKEETRKWLENYCKENFPDLHHMSY